MKTKTRSTKRNGKRNSKNIPRIVYMKDKRDKNATHTKCNEMHQTTKVKRDQSTNKMHPLDKL